MLRNWQSEYIIYMNNEQTKLPVGVSFVSVVEMSAVKTVLQFKIMLLKK